jgi:hypothetical protein
VTVNLAKMANRRRLISVIRSWQLSSYCVSLMQMKTKKPEVSASAIQQRNMSANGNGINEILMANINEEESSYQ